MARDTPTRRPPSRAVTMTSALRSMVSSRSGSFTGRRSPILIHSTELRMRPLLPFLVVFAATSLPVFSQNPPASKPAAAPADTAKTLEEVRGDLQAQRADLMAKNISLSAAEAAKFWPLYEKFQSEQNAIIDAQLKGVQEYAANYENMDDAKSLAFIDVQLKRDEAMVALRRKWLPQFQKVVSTPIA